MERIPADSWLAHPDHTRRYRWAAIYARPDDVVNDVACGVGYGATFLPGSEYHGYDRYGVPDARFAGKGRTFHACDMNDPAWQPETYADVTICFETLEHLKLPTIVANKLAATTRRTILVSVPIVPTKAENPYHLHDFTVDDVPALFHPWQVAEYWDQPEALAGVWRFERNRPNC